MAADLERCLQQGRECCRRASCVFLDSFVSYVCVWLPRLCLFHLKSPGFRSTIIKRKVLLKNVNSTVDIPGVILMVQPAIRGYTIHCTDENRSAIRVSF